MQDPTYLINLRSNEHSQDFHYYPFGVKLDECPGSCNTLNGLFNKLCVPNKIEDLNFSVESKTLTNHVPCECKCNFDRKKYNSNQWWVISNKFRLMINYTLMDLI